MEKTNRLLTIFVLILITAYFSKMVKAQDIVIFHTTEGDFKVKLYEETINHKQNFIALVEQGYYDSILFHRVIKNFMIQTGDPNSRKAVSGQSLGEGGPGYTIPAEFNSKYFHKKGVVAAARQGDQVNPEKQSSGSQFYIVQGQVLDNSQLDFLVNTKRHVPFTEVQRQVYTTIGGSPHLDDSYTIFGEVIEGIEIIDKIAEQQTDQKNRPIKDIRIIKAYIEK